MNLPCNIEAEKSVLGAILLDNESYLEASEELRAEDFSLDSHRRIYARMVGLLEGNRPVDMITLIDELATRKDLQAVGDVAYIASLIDGVPDRPSIAHYVAIVRDKAMLRRVIHLCNATLARATDAQGDSAVQIMADAEDGLSRICGVPRNQARPLKDLLPLVLNDMARERSRTTEFVGIPTGLHDLDEALGGMRPSELWIAGGMPSRGKTSFGIQFAINAVREGFPTVDFSLEMTSWQVVRRILAANSPAQAFGSRDAKLLDDAKWHQVIESAAQLATLPLFVDETSSLTLRELRAKTRLYKKKFGIQFVIVDYLRLLQAPGKDMRERVGNVAMALAQLAKDENICVLALSQLSRPQDLNDVPDMTSLKESGDLEANAHVVLLLYRPVDKDKGGFSGYDEIIIGKAREGPTSSVPVVYSEQNLVFKPRGKDQWL